MDQRLHRPLLAASFLLALSLHARAGDALVTSWNTSSVLRFRESNGAFVGAFVPSGSGNLNLPHSACFGPDGNLYVTSFGNDRVLRYDGTTGAFIDAFVPNGRGGLDGPTSASFGPNGNFFVASFFTPAVLEFDGRTGAFLRRFVRPGNGLQNAEAGDFGPDGDYYLANGPGNNVLRYDGTTGAFLGVFASGNGLLDPHQGTFGPSGSFFVAAFDNNRVNEYSPSGTFVRQFVSAGNGLINPHDVKFGPDGSLYVCAFGRDKVNRYDGTTGAFLSSFVPNGRGGLDGPISIVFMPDPASATTYGCDVNPAGSLSVLAGTSSIGTTLTLGVDNPLGTQSAGATPVLCLSFAPDPAFPCGRQRAGWGQAGPAARGEFLVSLAPTQHFLTAVGAPWSGTGSPAPFVLDLPADLELLGVAFYAQGLLLDGSAGAPVPRGLTDAIAFLLGF
jgi:streptogramin lyase